MTQRLALVLLLAASGPAAAQKSDRADATAALKKAKAHFNLQEYDQAEKALKEAYRLDPKPEILYAIAQAQRLGGACDRAIITYRNYLRTQPADEQAKQANDNITRCQQELAAAPTQPTPPPDTPPEQPPSQPLPVEPQPPRSPPPEVEVDTAPTGVPWTRNWLGHALVVGGLGLAAGGAYLALDGNSAIESINSAEFYDDFLARSEELDSARSRRTVGIGVASAGGAMVLTGVLLYILRSPSERPRASVSVGARGEVMFAWELR